MRDPARPPATLTRRHLVEILRRELGNASTARELVNAFFDEASDGLQADGVLKLHNFGSFATAHKRARVGRNLSNGEEMTIKARTVVRFKPSNKLRDIVRGAALEPASDGDG